MGWGEIDGWSEGDVGEVQDRAVAIARPDDAFIEVGVAYGRSLARLATKLKDLQKTKGIFVSVVGVDSWEDNPAEAYGGGAERTARVTASGGFFEDCKRQLKENLPVEILSMIALIRHPSTVAAQWAAMTYPNRIGFVFIDAAHDYDNVRADIAAWLPLVRQGGIIAGHDFSQGEYPGVVRAVREAFGTDFEEVGGCWLHVVREDGKL